MLNLTTQTSLRQASGEELLLLAIFGPDDLRSRIDTELDRRALTGIAGGRGVVSDPNPVFTGYAA